MWLARNLPLFHEMFSFLKSFFRRPADAPVETADSSVVTYPDANPHQYPNAFSAPARPLAHNQVPTAAPVATRQVGGYSPVKGIELSLQAVINNLPLELQPRILQREVGDATISVPLEVVLSQLSRGSVAVGFGQLRMAAPYAFSPEPDRDKTPVPLPLGEIIAKLNPNLMTRRRTQRHVEVPNDIVSPFDPSTQSFAFSNGPAPVEAPARRQTIKAAPVTPAPVPLSPIPMVAPGSRGALTSAYTPAPPTGAPIHAPNLPPARPAPVAPPNPALSYTVQPVQPIQPIQPAQPFQPIQPSQPAQPVQRAHAAPKAGAAEPLMIGLTSLAESWPENIRQEIVHANLVDAKLGLPVEIVEQALKQGRLSFSWKTVRSWVKNTAVAPSSAHDGTIVELPLKVVAPLFLTRKREAGKDQQKVNINTDIPNLFFGFPQPESTVAGAVAKPVDTNYYVWDDNSDTARVSQDEVKRAPNTSPGTRFISRCATPNEVVSRAAAIEGVAGALVALPDGLMVASRLSSDLNGDTLAAFLPQIFGKVTQCTKELRMGELNNLSFTVGNVPWKIFRVNAIFFAAFGRAGEALPGVQLAALAGELDHRAK